MKVGDEIQVVDSELGLVTGVITGFSREGYPRASFNGHPSVVVFPDMIVVKGQQS